MKTTRWSQGMAGRAWNSENQIRRRQMWAMLLIYAFPIVILPFFVSEWISPAPALFERRMIALGWILSGLSAVAFVSTVGRWAFWCAIDIAVSRWSKWRNPPPRGRLSGTFGV